MSLRFWRGEQLVNRTTAGDQDQVAVAALENGGYVAAWRDASGLVPAIRFQKFDAEGQRTGPERLLANANPGTDQDQPDILALPGGGFVIAARSAVSATNHNLHLYYHDNSGSLLSSVAVENGAADSGGLTLANIPKTVMNLPNEGQHVYAWSDNAGGTFDVKIGVRNPDGTLVHERVQNDPLTGEQDQVVIVRDSLSPVFDSSVEVLHRYRANTTSIIYSVYANEYDVLNNSRNPAIGDDLVESHIRQVLDGLDIFFGTLVLYETTQGQLVIETFGSHIQSTTGGRVTHNVVGTARLFKVQEKMVAVVFNRLDSNGTVNTYCTLYDRNLWLENVSLNTRGTEFRINTSSGGIDLDQGVDFAVLSDGRIVVMWTNTNPDADGSGSSVLSQIIDPRGGYITGTDDSAVAETLFGSDFFNDEMHGYAGNDTLKGLGGDDSLYGGDGNDTLLGGRGGDTAFGGSGADTVSGGGGDDLIDGGNANDTLSGNSGEDEIDGGAGSDLLAGGAAGDVLTGGVGNDRFIYNQVTDGGDSITDFSDGRGNNDSFEFARAVFTGSGAVLAAGRIAAVNFIVRTSDNQAQDGNDYFIYQVDTRQLWYDPTGNAVANDQVLIATLQAGAPMLANTDIFLV